MIRSPRQFVQEVRPQYVQQTRYEAFNVPVTEDDDEKDWQPLGSGLARPEKETDRIDDLSKIRYLSRRQPAVRQALRLYVAYVLGAGFGIRIQPRKPEEKVTKKYKDAAKSVQDAWEAFLSKNRRWWSLRELGWRTWRDGEQFTLKVDTGSFPPEVRFIDPEEIDDPQTDMKKGLVADQYGDGGSNKGIVTDPNDINQVQAFIRVSLADRAKELERIAAEDMFHTKIDVDSTQKRGISRFQPCIEAARRINPFLDNEYRLRSLQSSIVMQRKIKGSPTRVTTHLDNLKTSTTTYPEGTTRREKIRPGTILNTNDGVEIEFKQPENNFSDASPLLKQFLLCISQATGWPYYMISTDSADSNFASALVQESPVVLMVQEEREFFGAEVLDIWKWVIELAAKAGEIKGYRSFEKLMKDFEPVIEYPPLITRDLLKERQANNIAIMNKTFSVAESQRREGVDPAQMLREIEEEMESEVMVGLPALQSMNTSQQQKAGNSPSNQGDGQNQGEPGKDTSNSDKLA